ncbi:MAG: RtcB family protein [Gammaproteobacteria bacterium]|nr:RtcB family protein [Gammaproteobacteria bacterium]
MEGIEYNHRESIVDEIPDAYKDIDTVMKNQEDLVEVMAELKQVLSIKGD